MEGNFLQLLFVLAFLLIWVLGGGRRARQSPRPTERDRLGERPRPRPRPDATVPASSHGTTAEELFRILTGEAAAPGPHEADWAEEGQPLEEVHEVEARSLETLEPAGERSHQRFREKYMTEPVAPDQPGDVAAPSTRRPSDLRRAIIWREILGPPKGLQGEVSGGEGR